MTALRNDLTKLRYKGIVGTGGIGSGKFFMIRGQHTLGREESRSGHFLDVRDYCKQHIILHYTKVLLGPEFSVIPIGAIGDDDVGNVLLDEIQAIGMDLRHIEKIRGASTLFSFCFHYPDGSGGNLTTDNSASAQVSEVAIETAIPAIQRLGSEGIVMAVPEVSIAARKKLLELGRENKCFCTASFTSEEILLAAESGIMANVDFLSINLNEAAALTGDSAEFVSGSDIIENARVTLLRLNPDMRFTITAGAGGSCAWDGLVMHHQPIIKTQVESTAGAGDAFFSGILCGLAMGLTLAESQQLATLIAALSVTSKHTINPEINKESLRKFYDAHTPQWTEKISNLLTE